MNGYYSIFNPRGEKIVDCGILEDAVKLVGMRNKNWDGHYYQFKPTYEIVDVEQFPQNQLPSNQKYIGWKEVSENEFDEMFSSPKLKQLKENQQQPFEA